MDFKAAIDRANSRLLHDESWWDNQGIPMPQKFLLDSIAVPVRLLKSEPSYSPAMRAIGHEIYAESKVTDIREIRRIHNRRED